MFAGIRLSDGVLRDIGTGHSKDYNTGSGSDSGIIHVTECCWGPGTGHHIYVMASDQTIDNHRYVTTTNEEYSIFGAKDTNTIAQGGYLCKTGTTSGTTCGAYLGKETGKSYFDVKLQACPGDSGAGAAIAGYGYGILSQGVNEGTNGCTVPLSNQYVAFEELTTALIERNAIMNP